ncbi:A/G-specific adenine glycosylase [Dyadobacter jejuensis]|uniref:Adenine DNA glycosylase n=1 Tax=Dyadobacter jejuensis TaxID=1082580 RepID=A0A316ASR2_9BACT|nr:A/G-specific adenine glycosylase [Dyadobacter jejuensis]PWJ60304.1 A/G-specific adenine glycosylase [Dyadobacter jejuensis]
MALESLDKVEILYFNKILNSWYSQNARDLLWRSTKDPYKIWLSEIILQQTRVAQGTPYYLKFVREYPTVFDLARAEQQDVLRLWQGLGYYSRARNMHATAQRIVAEFDGLFPRSAKELLQFKGLGAYTAAAVASFAFDEVVPAIDGNVYRVLARIFGISADILKPEGKREFQRLAEGLISREDPATYNQAMIEFGALQCVPVAPDCANCVFSDHCYAYAHQAQGRLPVKTKKAKARNRYLNYFILHNHETLVMKERIGKGIWEGLYDFYEIESDEPMAVLDSFSADSGLLDLLGQGVVSEVPKSFVHLLTHQKLHVQFWRVDFREGAIPDLPNGYKVYPLLEIEKLPKPILIDLVLKEEGLLE